MELYRVWSTNLRAARYDSATHQLYVLFRSGYCYVYFGVAPALYEQLVRTQPHPWSAVGRTVMRHRHHRIVPLPVSAEYAPRAA